MDLPLKVDLSRLEMSSVANLLTPVAPGVVLVAGSWYLHPFLVEQYFHSNAIGYGSKLCVVVLTAYVAGLLISTLTAFCMNVLGILVVQLVIRKAVNKLMVWQFSAFRKVALLFLGPLAPPDELPMSNSEYELELQKCTFITPDFEALKCRIEVENAKWRRQKIDWDWQAWYKIVTVYFRSPNSAPQADVFALRAAAATAVAGLILLFSHHVAFNAVWMGCWLSLAFACIQESLIIADAWFPDVAGDKAVARMFDHVESAENAKA